MKRTITFLASTPFLLAACGLATKGPPAGHEKMMTGFSCTESMAAPILDLLGGLAGIWVVGEAEKLDEGYPKSDAGTYWSIAFGGIYGVSAVVGFDRVTRCREAKRDLRARQAEAAAAVAARRRSADLIAVQKVLITGGRDTMTVGERTQLVATAYDSTGAVIVDKMFAWSSSNDTIASVTTDGRRAGAGSRHRGDHGERGQRDRDGESRCGAGPMKRTIVFLASTPFLLGACGLAMTQGPPAGHESMPSFQCTEDRRGPALDIVLVVWNTLLLTSSAARNQLGSGEQAALAIGTAIAAISAGVGFDRTRRCIKAKGQLAVRQAEVAAARRRALDLIAVQRVLITGARDTMTVGEWTQLVATAYDSSGAAIVDKTFTWSSSNDTVAFVRPDGILEAEGPGTAVITAQAANGLGTASLVVLP